MRALLLEDDDLRGRLLVRELRTKGYAVTWARNVAEAVDALVEGGYDFATLDHDLGPRGTGLDVVNYIATLPPELRPKRIEVHSMNPIGAARMMAALESVGAPVTRRKW